MPAYLAQLPLDPFTGRPFGYRISEGEVLHPQLTLAPGQALVWSEVELSTVFPVPMWKK